MSRLHAQGPALLRQARASVEVAKQRTDRQGQAYLDLALSNIRLLEEFLHSEAPRAEQKVSSS